MGLVTLVTITQGIGKLLEIDNMQTCLFKYLYRIHSDQHQEETTFSLEMTILNQQSGSRRTELPRSFLENQQWPNMGQITRL